jgi:hypothetical protein
MVQTTAYDQMPHMGNQIVFGYGHKLGLSMKKTLHPCEARGVSQLWPCHLH